jgi:hypothetical protein
MPGPFVGNGSVKSETNNGTPVARQQILNNTTGTTAMEELFFYVVRAEKLYAGQY